MERKGIFIKVFFLYDHCPVTACRCNGNTVCTAICVLFQSDGSTANSKILSAIGGTDSE